MIAVVFPGQGSQRPGMGKDLYGTYGPAKDVFHQVSEATGVDAAALCFESDEETLRKTENAQLALYTCGLAAWFSLKEGLSAEVDVFAGHSVGEYAAVVAAGALGVGTGAMLVRRRGEIMAAAGQSRPGTMAAVLGMDRADLAKVCEEVSDKGVCVIANDNAPGQLVISGDVDAVQAACALAGERGAKRTLPLNVSGAFHSPLMDVPAQEMGQALAEAGFGSVAQRHVVFANVTAARVEHAYEWPDLLERQLKSPVRWTESVHAMAKSGVRVFVECGVGEVLCGLLRRIEPEAKGLKVVDPATLEQARSELSAVNV
ncbi:MAG: ACP S-malonyltransferase [Armatimonadetes bacterium]|nr:ACP S-malonyltransferase [Armatimonadota bacterium]